MASLLAGLPQDVAGETVNRLCASGLAAAVNAGRAMKDGAGDLYIAGGVEHMTRGPWVISKTSSAFGRDAQMFDSSFGWRFINPKMEAIYGVDSMGMTAENLAEQFSISREDQDAFACWSQEKTAKATSQGYFEGENSGNKGNSVSSNYSNQNDADTQVGLKRQIAPTLLYL